MNKVENNSRRKFLKKSAYVVPVVMTMHAAPSLAGHGSPKKKKGNNGVGNGPDYLPRGLQKNGKSHLDNDDKWGTPGNPQNRGGFKTVSSKSSRGRKGH